jgi:hypothetical protein
VARLNLSRHWKFRRVARAVNSTAYARGLLEQMWEAAYEAASAYIGSPADIADAAGWDGEPVEFVAILLDAEFLDERAPGEYVVHDLWDHVPPYVKLKWTRANPGTTPPWHRDAAKIAAKGPPIANERTHPCGDRAQDDRRSRTCTGRVGSGKKEQRRQTASRSLRSDEKTERPNVRVLVRLGYELAERGERFETEADLADALKTIAAWYRVPYDGASIGRALEFLAHARAPLWIDAPQARRRTA